MSSNLKSLKALELQNQRNSPFIPTEILQKISSYFAEDKSSLFSCILVSRHWCISLIETLWSQPFHLSHSPRLIEIYLSFLPETSLDQLNIKNLNSKKKEHKSVFEYPSFLRKLSIPLLCNAIGEYLRKELNIATFTSSKINYYTAINVEQVMYTDLLKLFSKQKKIQVTSTFKLLFEKQIIILRELCKLIYNKINILSEFESNIALNFSEDMTFLDRPLVEESMNLQDCIKGLKVLEYSGNSDILCFLAKHCRRIESLKLLRVSYSKEFIENFGKNNVVNDDPSIQLISTQKNLRNLEFHDWDISPSTTITPPSITSMLQSIQTQSNSLRSIKLVNCNFYKSKPLWPLSKCQNLEEIIIKENYNFNERLLIPLMKAKFLNLKIFIYRFQLMNFIEDDDHIDEVDDLNDDEVETNLDEIFSSIIVNAKDSLHTVAINGFKTLQSLRNTLNSLVECKNLIKLHIMLEKSENTLPLLLSIIEHNRSIEKLYIISDTLNFPNQFNNNLFIDANQFLHSFVKALPHKFKLLRLYTPDWSFSTNTLEQILEKTKFKIKSICWMNYGCNLECSEVLRQYAKQNGGCKLLFGEDCEFVNNNDSSIGPFRMNVSFNCNE